MKYKNSKYSLANPLVKSSTDIDVDVTPITPPPPPPPPPSPSPSPNPNPNPNPPPPSPTPTTSTQDLPPLEDYEIKFMTFLYHNVYGSDYHQYNLGRYSYLYANRAFRNVLGEFTSYMLLNPWQHDKGTFILPASEFQDMDETPAKMILSTLKKIDIATLKYLVLNMKNNAKYYVEDGAELFLYDKFADYFESGIKMNGSKLYDNETTIIAPASIDDKLLFCIGKGSQVIYDVYRSFTIQIVDKSERVIVNPNKHDKSDKTNIQYLCELLTDDFFFAEHDIESKKMMNLLTGFCNLM
jgi:hypothetical protein